MKTGTSYNPDHIYQSVNYYATCSNDCHTSNTSNLVTITVLNPPGAPYVHQHNSYSTTSLPICRNTGVSLWAEGCANGVKWYQNGDYSTTAGEGNPFNSSNLSEETTFTARCKDTNGCGDSGNSNPFAVTIKDPPSAPYIHQNNSYNTTSLSICQSNSVSLWAENCSNGVKWYKDGNYSTTVGEGNPFDSGNLSDGATFTARCKDTNGCGDSGNSNSFSVTINSYANTITITAGASLICPEGATTLTVNNCNGIVYWLDNTNLHDNPRTVGIGTYTAKCQAECGYPTQSQITIKNQLDAPVAHLAGSTATSLNICPGGSFTLQADGCPTPHNWFRLESNGSESYIGAYNGGSDPTLVAQASPSSVTYVARCHGFSADCPANGPASNPIVIRVLADAPVAHLAGSTATSLNLCAGQSFTLRADGCPGVPHNWFRLESNGSETWVGAYNMDGEPALVAQASPSSVTYVARCHGFSADCPANGPASNPIVIRVLADAPVAHLAGSTATSLNICPGGSFTLQADGCPTPHNWFRLESNGSESYIGAYNGGSDPTLVAQASPSSVTYVARCHGFSADCPANGPASNPIVIRVLADAPVAHLAGSTATSLNLCAGQSFTLRADGCPGVPHNWFRLESNGSETWVGAYNMDGEPALVAQASPSSVTYVARCHGFSADCPANGPASNPIVIRVLADAPVAHLAGSTATSLNICPGGSFTLQADGCPTPHNWFRLESNGSESYIGAYNGGSDPTLVAQASPSSVTYVARCHGFSADCPANGPASNPIVVTISPSTSPTLTARLAGVSTAQSLTLTASGCPTGSTVQWSGPNNTTATGSSWLIASFTQTSTYSAQCQSNTGCPSTAQITVTYLVPSAPIIHTTATQVCTGQTVTLTADGCQAGTTVIWSGGQTGQSLVLTPTATATYKAYCVAGEVVGDPSPQIYITVLSSHTVTISGSQTFAVGETISLSAVSSASGAVTYRWSGPNNFTSTAQNPSIPTATTAMIGTYTVVATNANSCTATASYALSVAASDISCSCQDCDAPEWQTDVIAVGNANTGTTYNSVVVDTYLSPTSSVGGTTERSQQIAYLDGFGRPLQMIQTGASPTGKDVVAPVAYDGFGRVTKNYLPYTDAAGGSFKNNALTAQAGFYSGLKGDAAAYAETLLDASPLQRITQQGSIGSAWQPNAADANKTGVIKANYRISSETTIPKLAFAYSGTTWTLSRYAARQLFVNETKDANNNTVVAFTDILGQTVCKKVYNGTDVLTTYYAYDDFGRLCLTFPPKAAQKLESQADGIIDFTTADAFKDQIYWYVYDARGRVVEKKTSDATIEEMVYNLHDQVVLYRNGLHRKQNQWLYSKYDELGRMVSKGVYASVNSRTAEQTNVNNSFAPAPVFGDLAYPTTGLTELSRSYYDDYAFTPKKSPDQPTEFGLGTLATEGGPVNLIGKLTGNQETVLKASGAIATAKTTLLTTYYYDQYGRQVQTRQENHLSGEDLSSVRLDFAGRVLETKLTTSAYSKTTSVWTRNTYTRNNQLKMTCQRINDGNKEPVGRYSYNELGEMTEKWQGCKLQVITYQTDIRGRLTGINSSDPVQLKANKQFFGLKLEYSLDDNISAQEWGSVPNLRAGATLPAKRRYDYTYDPIGRIKGASYSGGTSENFSVSGINYDLNGNLLSMNRRVQTPSLGDSPNEDQLTYAYAPNSNQLRNVQDAGVATPASPKKAHYFNDRNRTADDGIRTGFTTADDYAYDEAGNLVRDLNRDIRSIDYNVLGLPETITFGNQTKIYYLYTGGGDKLQKQGAYLPTNQAGQYAQKQIDYAGGLVYTEQAISFIPTAEGRALPPLSGATTTDYRYEYQQTDQLGNLRSACRCGEKFDANGNLVPTTGSEDPRTVVQENHFDPWGLNLADIETQPGSSTDLWQFTGQERDYQAYTEFKLRQYDATLGRFTSVDPMADAFSNISPFNYADNSPIANIDLYGLQKVPISAIAQAEADGLGIFLNGGSVMYNIAPGMSQVVSRFANEFAGAIGNNLLGMATAVMHPIETTKAVGRSVGETLIDLSYRSPNMPMCGGCPNPNYTTLEGKARQQRAIRELNETVADIKAHPGAAAGNAAFFLFGPKVFGKIGGKVSSLASRLEVVPNTLGANFGNLRLKGSPAGFTSTDPYVADLANAIEEAYPGTVLSVNRDIPHPSGVGLATDFDIETIDAVIQVKSQAKGLLDQMRRTSNLTNKTVIGYAPKAKLHVRKGMERAGVPFATDKQSIIDLLKPKP